jgi:chemotaxis protein MotB
MSSSGGAKRQHHEEHEEHVNHEAWVIPYADVLTLLMALFLVLFALGQSDDAKLTTAAESFRRELGMSSPIDFGGGAGALGGAGASVLDGAGPAPLSNAPPMAPPPETTSEPVEAEVVVLDPVGDNATELADPTFDAVEGPDELLGDPLDVVEQVVRDQAAGTGLLESIGFRREARGLVVTIVTDKVLFDPGKADVQPGGEVILGVVANALAQIPNGVVVEGHTDSRPISTAQFPSNWELSTARATSVLRYLTETRGLSAARVAASGYADTRPVADGTDPTSLAQNRRVEIVVLATR